VATTWYLDQAFHLDQEDSLHISGEGEILGDVIYTHAPLTNYEIEMKLEIEGDVQHAVLLDLLPLVPEKFRSSSILQAYLRTAGIHFGSFLTSVRDIVLLLGPNTVASNVYLRHLGALIGVEFPPEDESTPAEIRKTLADAVEWYKLKGTYRSIDIIALIQSFTVNIFDMYTNDYSTFVLTDWFVGDEDENPPGLDSSYYKSPHFGAEIVLNQTYTLSGTSLQYLWRSNFLDNFAAKVEKTRPVHTVPHYLLLLNPKTDEFGHLITTVGGQIKTKVTPNWQYSTKYFDLVGSGNFWSFDTGDLTFDTSAEGFLNSITKWVLGTGNYPSNLGDTSFTIENPVLEGVIAAEDITDEGPYFQFEFIVPKGAVQAGLSELGLYIPGTPDMLVVASTFPKLDKTALVELRAVVQIYKSDLS